MSSMYMERTATSENKFTQFYTHEINVTDEIKTVFCLKICSQISCLPSILSF